MMVITRPSRLNKAMGLDALGVATATLSRLVPSALSALVGWFAEDDPEPPPRWAGYSETFRFEPSGRQPPRAVPTLLYHRLDGQPVSLDMQFSAAPRAAVVITVDGQQWGVFDEDLADVTVPDELLLPGRGGNLHSLTVRPIPGTVLTGLASVEVMVVVRMPGRDSRLH